MSQVMYIGPDVKSVVAKNQMFTYDPEKCKEKVAEIYKPAKELFVDVEELAEKRNELKREGSYLNLIYKNFEKKLGGNNG